MEFGRRKLCAKRSIDKVHFCDESFSFGDGSTLAEDPRDELELGDIVAVGFDFMKNGVVGKKKTGHTEAFFVDGVVKERIIIAVRIRSDERNAHDGIVRIEGVLMAEGERKITGSDGDGFAIRKFIIKVATEIMIFGSISSGCAHVCFPFGV